MPTWTQEQQKAIDLRERSLLVAAAAGSGKTAVLVERICKALSSVSIENLLIVTFTNAAAAEMRQRIADAIQKNLLRHPDDAYMQNQLLLLNKASIMTIHSFCLAVVRQNFHILDMDPAVRIGDETEILLTKAEVLEVLFEDLYEASDPDFLLLVETFGENTNDKKLQSLILDVHRFMQASPHPAQWLTDAAAAFFVAPNIPLFETVWGEVIYTDIFTQTAYAFDLTRRSMEIISLPDGPKSYESAILSDYQMLVSLQQALCEKETDCFERVYRLLDSFCFESLKASKKNEPEPAEEVKKNRKEVKEVIEGITEAYCFKPPSALLGDIQKNAETVQALAKVVLLFAQRFQSAKKEKNRIDFHDIEHFCLQVFYNEDGTATDIAKGYRNKFAEIYIDEYQDSNYVQEAILSAVSRKEDGSPNMFMVGDVKQSIYKFRQAAPELFMHKYSAFSNDEQSSREVKIDLSQNFRSRQIVVDTVNLFFMQLMTKEAAEIAYDDKAALYGGASFPDTDLTISTDTEIIIADRSADQEEETEEKEELTKYEQEARLVAARIQKLIADNFHVYDASIGAYRPVCYRDMTILLRSANKYSKIYADELAQFSIGAYADVQSPYFGEIEVMTVMSVLQVIDNPRQDVHLLAVLHSPIFALDADTLVAIRYAKQDCCLYEALLAYVASEEGAAQQSLHFFLETLTRWREYAVVLSIEELLEKMYDESGYYRYAGAMPGGKMRQANLRILKEKALSYENTSFKGLFHFIRFLEKLEETGAESPEAKLSGENENLVRIMSIHKSKGLEFPVVFVCGLGNNFNLMDIRKNVLMHRKLGFGLDYTDLTRRVQMGSITKAALAKKIRNENYAEEQRILYVALTRAKEKLILTGAVRNLETAVKKWCAMAERVETTLPTFSILRAGCFLDWIGMVLARHKDGEALRKLAQKTETPANALCFSHPAKFTITVATEQTLAKKQADDKEHTAKQYERIQSIDTQASHSPYTDLIRKRLGYRYPHSQAVGLPLHISISEMKKRFQSEDLTLPDISPEITLTRPSFLLEQSGLTAAEKGIAMHTAMEALDFKKTYTMDELSLFLDRLEAQSILSTEERKCIPLQKILRFQQSNIAKRIHKAEEIYKEQAFALSLPASYVYGAEAGGEEEILVRGIIDCFFVEKGKLVLLDYKTDTVTEATIPDIVERYKVQLSLYKRALWQITKKEVSETVLYLFGMDRGIVVEDIACIN